MTASAARARDDEMQLTITYDGESVQNNRMAIADLAPAMLSLARLIETTTERLTGEANAVRVEVRADFKRGSFSFDIITSVLDSIKQKLFDNLSISDILQTLGFFGTAGVGLLTAVRRLRGRRIVSVESNGPKRLLRLDDGATEVVEQEVQSLLMDPEVRAYVEGFTAPLRKPGYDLFVARVDRGLPVKVARDEAVFFTAPPPASVQIQDTTRQELVRVLSPDFQAGHKWQVSLAGERPFFAAIADVDFLHRVGAHAVKFGPDDILRADVQVQVHRKEDGDYVRERTIVKVHEHIPGERVVQGDLLLDK